MTDDSTTTNESMMGMHRSMLICCGGMILILGTFGISSVATAVGFSTGQTYLAIAGFVVTAGALLVYLYQRQASNRDNPLNSLDDVERESQ
jgi:hypothetical protein